MGLKKYEIITVGSDKRVRALRSWAVGGRYVNIGDVGGIVYDEKTLSQDGACWLFRGNFGFPGARIGGDSIVDVAETALSTAGAPAVDVLGSSVVVGGNLRFGAINGAAYATILKPTDFEQGTFSYAGGANWETWKTGSLSNVRLKSPIFMGGVGVTLKLDVPGYTVQAYVLDRDGIGLSAVTSVNTGEGVTLEVPAGQYFTLRLAKNPTAATVPADAATAAIKITTVYEGKLVINDSRLEVSPANGTGAVTIRPGGTYTIAPGAKYPDSVIQNSKVSIASHATANRTITLMAEFINTSAVIAASVESAPSIVGVYSNVKNLTFSGGVTGSYDINIRGAIQANDCDNFTVSATIFPGLAAAQKANMPFIFQGCNVPNGIFYHHAQIANTYKNIDFAKASVDLGKTTASDGVILVSSEVEGMYRAARAGAEQWGALVERSESVSGLGFPNNNPMSSYGTTIYKDAYFKGTFIFEGTNVFGNTKKHDTSNTQDVSGVLVGGLFNATTNGGTISGVVANNARAVVAQPFRVSGAGGVSVSSPAGVECNIYLTDAANKILVNTGYVSGTNAPITPALPAVYAYIAMKKTDGSDILSMDEFKGVTVTVYNGCKIVNTGAAAVNMKGNIRVEDNATLVNADITGTGYFGGNCVASGLIVKGCAFMNDNATLVKTSEGGAIRRLYMRDNSRAVISAVTVFGLLDLRDNAVFSPASYGVSEADIIMRDNAAITGMLSANGVLKMEGNAAVSEGRVTIVGDITLCGSYNQTVSKSWTGKRVIDSVDAPNYDDNVKTQYDF